MDSNRKPKSLRVSRRQTLKSLGALALGGPALAAVGCSSSDSAGAAEGGGAPGTTPSSPAGTLGANGGASGRVAAAGTGASQTGKAVMASAPQTSMSATPTPTAAITMPAASPATGGTSAAAGATASTASAGSSGGVSLSAGSGGSGAAPTSSTSIDMLQCIATPAMTDGPFFVEEKLDRANLIMGETADTLVQAMPLRLVIGVFDVKGMMCTPVAGATVDIWHADSVGIYSDVASGIVQSMDTRGKKFLRGYQVTDERGLVAFDTIYPGWYMSRTIHIHFKLRMLGSGSSAKEFTSQMFFDEAINAKVLAQGPYATHTGRQVMNDDDHIFNGTAMNGQKPASGQEAPGKAIMPTMEMMGNGYVATLKIGLMG